MLRETEKQKEKRRECVYYEGGGQSAGDDMRKREHKLTLNLLLPHQSVNFTLVSFFVLIFQCDSIDCPLLLHKRIQIYLCD